MKQETHKLNVCTFNSHFNAFITLELTNHKCIKQYLTIPDNYVYKAFWKCFDYTKKNILTIHNVLFNAILFSYHCLHNALKEMKYLYNQMDINAIVIYILKEKWWILWIDVNENFIYIHFLIFIFNIECLTFP